MKYKATIDLSCGQFTGTMDAESADDARRQISASLYNMHSTNSQISVESI